MGKRYRCSHFRSGVSRLRFCSLWPHAVPKMEGVSKGGQSPFGTRLLERSGKSLVCYTFCPGWCGKGDVRECRRFPAPGKQAEEWSDSSHSSAYFREGQKVYTTPVSRPPSRRSDINEAASAADRSERLALCSAPASPSARSVPPFLGYRYHSWSPLPSLGSQFIPSI